jgi:hypothetical protein
MALRASVTDRKIDLPPLYSLVTLREVGDAFAHACKVAGDAGAGTLVWTRRADVAEFAVVLEPEEPLATARRAFYAGMNALADTLANHAPPERPISFDWPDAIRVDGVLVGGGRLGWPPGPEDDVPEWLVFAGMVRTMVLRAGEPGLRPLLGSLDEVGFEALDAGEMLESFSRHLMAGFHDWREEGFERVAERYLARLSNAEVLPRRHPRASGARPEDPSAPVSLGTRVKPECDNPRDGAVLLAEHSDLLADGHRERLRDALAAPSWRDPATGMPWL